ncbi:hypothetical protein [Nostoc parmelioides]|uniref:Uncharacterized protein n=1 Tax=Nostoc parmelioides FACHB-3921 TaxID=2692909 RepID=A0ABR8BK57_9NOSO|nr:hypothetical protein [Nostoc parmelioides]MBD2254255.1 hypothetical protein [Nostoc parmelioides FACHB-3921]
MSIKILESVDSSEIKEFRAEILSKRSLGNVLFEIKQIRSYLSLKKAEDLTEILDLFVSQMGYVGLDVHWKEIHQAAAEKILAFVLTKDLAYSSKIMAIEEAEKISTKMFNFFPNPCKFFTNAVFANNYSALSAWDSLTDATFDTGIIFVSATLIGMLWVKDED